MAKNTKKKVVEAAPESHVVQVSPKRFVVVGNLKPHEVIQYGPVMGQTVGDVHVSPATGEILFGPASRVECEMWWREHHTPE